MTSPNQPRAIKTGIVGASGYIGIELLALLQSNPGIELKFVTSRANAGMKVDTGHDSRLQALDLHYIHPDDADVGSCDAVFFATPSGVCAKAAKDYIDAGTVVFDLSGDHRLHREENILRWYGEQVNQARASNPYTPTFGLPEWNREAIEQAKLISCPGCYVTTSLLPLVPLLKEQIISKEIIIDAKSGVTGAGKEAQTHLLFAEVSENFSTYNMAGHRHTVEIQEQLEKLAGQSCNLVFTPQLLPIRRGLMSMMYVKASDASTDPVVLAQRIRSTLDEAYRYNDSINILPEDENLQMRLVQFSNKCYINVFANNGIDHSTVTLVSVLDNLQKGAAAQAIQNLNIRFARPINLGIT